MRKSLLYSFTFIGEVGFATALPLVIFGLLGRYLDKKYGASPWFLLAGILIATIQIYFYLRVIIQKAEGKFKNIH
ncbi:MAG: AtpZ/AtpI family protein [Patescibacteria group bacterium]